MQKKPWLVLALAAMTLGAGSVYAGDDEEEKGSKEVTASEEVTENQSTPTECGCPN